MQGKIHWRWWLTAAAFIGLLLCGAGCATKGVQVQPVTDQQIKPYQSIAVMPFYVAGGNGNIQTVTTCQQQGEQIKCQKVSSQIGLELATSLAREIAIYGLHRVVEPQQVLSAIPDLGMVPVQQIGRTLGVDMLVFGTVSRFLERIGGPYGVTRPASVRLEIYLVDAHTGKRIWLGKFDHTQRGLSEDLTNIGSFFRGGGKWLTARELADAGIASLVSQMPGLKGKEIK